MAGSVQSWLENLVLEVSLCIFTSLLYVCKEIEQLRTILRGFFYTDFRQKLYG
jgi:hypothetical protein